MFSFDNNFHQNLWLDLGKGRGREEKRKGDGRARKSGMEGGETLERRFSDFSAAFSFY